MQSFVDSEFKQVPWRYWGFFFWTIFSFKVTEACGIPAQQNLQCVMPLIQSNPKAQRAPYALSAASITVLATLLLYKRKSNYLLKDSSCSGFGGDSFGIFGWHRCVCLHRSYNVQTMGLASWTSPQLLWKFSDLTWVTPVLLNASKKTGPSASTVTPFILK